MLVNGINENTAHGPHLIDELMKVISEEVGEIAPRLIANLRHINHRADCIDGVVPEQIDYQSSNEYLLTYSYEWTIYNGCADMNEQDTVEESIIFTVEDDGTLEFDFEVVSERNTLNEF